jgi:hypothetical protein
MPLQLRSPVGEQDLLETGSTTWVQLFFPPACQVWIAPNSKVLVSRLVPESGMSATLQVVIGQVRATIGSLLGYPEQVFGVEAESVYAAPRGTDFVVVREAPGRSQVVVIEGAVELSGQALGSLRLEAGQLARLGEGGQLLGTSSLQIGELQRLGLDASPKQNVDIAAGWMTPVSPRPVSPLPVIPLLPQPLLPGVRADRSGWSVVLEPQ